ncbi:hypothetical protein ACFQ3N_02515 [Virgibacillus byunsanensis]|uniref:Uncharacterized protein n=1 Tax=Virgibacillus byunsanensis TaxID=570945 RepID=A0ABW3LFX3_9BACI
MKKQKLGTGLSSVFLIARWITGALLLVSVEAMIRIGVLSGLGFALAGMSAFLIFGLLLRALRKRLYGDVSYQDLLDLTYDPVSKIWMIRLFCLSCILILYIHILAGAIFLYAVVGLNIVIGFLLFSLVAFFIVYIDRKGLMTKYNVYAVSLLQFALIIFLVNSFMINGVEPIYKGIKLYHPYLLVYENKSLYIFIIASFTVMLGKMLLDPYMWQSLFRTDNTKVMTAFSLSGVIWATFPIAFSTLILTIIHTGGFENINTVLYRLFHRIDIPGLKVIFIGLFLFIMLSSFINELKKLLSHLRLAFYKNKGEQESRVEGLKGLKRGIFITILIVFGGLLTTWYLQPSIIDVFYFNSVFFASVCAPIVIAVLRTQKSTRFVPLIICISVATGYIITIFWGITTALIAVFIISTSLCVLRVGRNI